MRIEELLKQLPVTVAGDYFDPAVTVAGGYVSDLLSHVMGQAKAGNVWVTMQGHQNIAAVASLVGIAVIIIAGGIQPDTETLQKADQERIVILTTKLTAYEVVGRLYQLGIC